MNTMITTTTVDSNAGLPLNAPAKAAKRVRKQRREWDVLPVEVEILDAKGRVVPTADDLVAFPVKGAGFIAGAGNGNPGDHDPDQASARHAFHGKRMAVIRVGEKPGRIGLTALSAGLKGASLKFKAVRPRYPRLSASPSTRYAETRGICRLSQGVCQSCMLGWIGLIGRTL